MTSRSPAPFAMLGTDIESYSSRGTHDQAELRRGHDEVLATAFIELGLHVPPENRQDRGDGQLMLFPADTRWSRLVADVPREIAGALTERNRNRTQAGRLRIRIVVHHGMVARNGAAWTGSAVVEAVRILEADTGRRMLRASDLDRPLRHR